MAHEDEQVFQDDSAGLGAVARGLAGARDTGGVLTHIAELARGASAATAVYLEQVHFARNEVEVIAASGVSAPSLGARVPYPGSLAQEALESEEPELVTPEELASRPIAGVLSAACRSCDALVVPLISQRVALGALIIFRDAGVDPFTAEEIRRLRLLADMAALALRQVLSEQEAQRRLMELAESEQRFRLLVTAVSEYAIFMLDPGGRVVSWNEGAQRIKGYTEDEIVGQHYSVFYTKEDLARRHPQTVLRLATERGSYTEEGWRVRRDGSRFCADVTVTALRNRDGDLVGFAKVTRDLSERRTAAAVLEHSTSRFEELAENVSEIFWVLEPDLSAARYVNGAFARIYGRDPAEFIMNPRSFLDSVAEDDRPGVEAALQMMRTEDARVEYRIVSAGEPRWLSMRGYPVRQRDGDVYRIVGVTEDITAEKKATAALRENERRLQFLADAATALGSSLEYRKTLQRVADLAVPELADWCAVDVVEDDEVHRVAIAHVDPAKVRFAWQLAEQYPPAREGAGGAAQVLASGQPLLISEVDRTMLEQSARDPHHLELLTDLGMCSAIVVPMNARGRALGVITLIAADSGRRYQESDVSLAVELGARAAMAVDNARLHEAAQAALAEAERVQQSRARLVRGFSHDLKNPLGAADGYAQLLLDGIKGELQPGQRQSIERMRVSLGAALDLINELVELARTESGQLEIRPSSFDARGVVSELMAEFSAQASAAGLSLECDVPDHEIPLHSDRQRVRQILANLLSNAVKYTDDGTVTVRVATIDAEGAAGRHVAFDVVDTGPGIPDDQQEVVFREFTRLAHGKQGAGLGLAISRRIARLLGGDVHLSSAEGQGATFTLQLPAG